MCGISAVLGRRAGVDLVGPLLRMHAAIPHRGPDGEGALLSTANGSARLASGPAALPHEPHASFALAFRRLKILDLSELASQPMASADGSAWLIFNGEIFNFQELRDELRARGRTFRSRGDTEVVLAAWEAWGESCFERLEGMWAIVIADLRARRLVASRDRFGIKPLYWAADDERFYLSSEVRQILAGRGERSRANAPLLASYLRGQRLPCLEETFFADIRAVPPAAWFELPLDVAPAEPVFRRYWDLAGPFANHGAPPPYPDAVDRLHSLLGDVVATHDIADVTVGSLLSGGLDSSVVTALHARLGTTSPRIRPTFSLGFREQAPEVCELPYVDALVKQEGLLNHESTFDADWLWRSLDRVIGQIEEPPLAIAPFAQDRVFQACRDGGAVVVLDGTGSDEIFGGYFYYQRDLLVDRALRGNAIDLFRETTALLAAQEWNLWHFTRGAFVKPFVRRLRPTGNPWLAPDYGMRGDSSELRLALTDRGRDPSRVNRRLFGDVRWGNVKVVLPYSDKNAMAHSVEARLPYFDRRIVEFAFSLPDVYKVGSGQRKRVLRDVGRRLLPGAITERKDRMGFGVPTEKMLRSIWPRARGRLLDSGILSAPPFVRSAAEEVVGRFESGGAEEVWPVWRMLAALSWRDTFDVALG